MEGHKFSKMLEVTSKFHALEEWHEPSSMPRAHKY